VRNRITGAALLMLAIVAPAVAFSGAAVAAPETASFVLPDVRGETLQRALKNVYTAAGTTEIEVSIVNRKNTQEVINRTAWEVCSQSPGYGQEILTTKRIILAVRRLNTTGC
jgi:hypothetical protein